MWTHCLLLLLVTFVTSLAVRSSALTSAKKSSLIYSGGAFGPPLGGPQQNFDGLWTFVAVPIPLENQTVPSGDFPLEQVAQAKLWGPIYRSGHGWIYGEAGFILVPRVPPYVPPTIIPPPRAVSSTGSAIAFSGGGAAATTTTNRIGAVDKDSIDP